MNRKEKKFRKKHNIKEVFSERMVHNVANMIKKANEFGNMDKSWFWSIW